MLNVKFESNFGELERRLKRIGGSNRVQLRELFSPEFMRRHTSHSSFDAFVKASPFTVENADDFHAIPDADWDKYVRSSARFNSWADMQKQALADWVKGQLAK